MRGWIFAPAALLLATACSASDPQSATGADSNSGGVAVGPMSRVMSADDYRPSLFDADSADVDNRWYPLRPGARLVYRGSSLEDGERVSHTVVAVVTDLTKVIDGVSNAVVWERDFLDGELVEAELAMFAQDRYGNVWHMGEYPEEYEEGELDKAPAWIHGIKGASAGVTIPGLPTLGTPDYAQGYAPPPINWVDRGRVHETGATTCVPDGCYDDVVVIAEFETGVPHAFQDKYYAVGVGVVRVGWRGSKDDSKEVLRLVSMTHLSPERLSASSATVLRLEARAYRTSAVYALTVPSEQRE
ncbi:MAG TPA: hypothetical protein VLK34_08960 [Nocardioidaceae bacterium]|nr:hypothetical protein [Nocardioidaceae bacterium]